MAAANAQVPQSAASKTSTSFHKCRSCTPSAASGVRTALQNRRIHNLAGMNALRGNLKTANDICTAASAAFFHKEHKSWHSGGHH